jgi:hypothetical protein
MQVLAAAAAAAAHELHCHGIARVYKPNSDSCSVQVIFAKLPARVVELPVKSSAAASHCIGCAVVQGHSHTSPLASG